MPAILECVPNFSEGKDEGKIRRIVDAASSIPQAIVADVHSDPDHNRTVITLIGKADAVVMAALAAGEEALAVVDLREHAGVHPRVGVVDVVPFVPLAGTSMDAAVDVAHRFGRLFAEQCRIPVFMYAEAAQDARNRELPQIRRGGLDRLNEQMQRGLMRPDYGPPVCDLSKGASIVGARRLLIAYNINLESDDLDLAQRIASHVRERNGGLPGLKALGLRLASRGIVQVSMNVTDYHLTPLSEIFRRVKEEVSRAGVSIRESELVGLAPADALNPEIAEEIRLKDFTPERIIEYHLAQHAVDFSDNS